MDNSAGEMWVSGRSEGEARKKAAKQLGAHPSDLQLVQGNAKL